MKKTMMFLGVLSLGLAHAQQYDGKVGVNTDQPNATLNVKSKTGTTEATKNFELQNAADTKLVTVLDNGNVGIGTDAPTANLQIDYTGDNPIKIKHKTLPLTDGALKSQITFADKDDNVYGYLGDISALQRLGLVGVNYTVGIGSNKRASFDNPTATNILAQTDILLNSEDNNNRMIFGTYNQADPNVQNYETIVDNWGRWHIGWNNTEIDTRSDAKFNVRGYGNTASSKTFQLSSANNTRLMTVLNNGNVGIGTEIPKHKLQIDANNQNPVVIKNTQYVASDEQLRSYMAFKDKDDVMYGYVGDGSQYKRITFGAKEGYQASVSTDNASVLLDPSSATDRIIVETLGNGGEINRTYIDNTGKWRIGISEHTAEAKLQVGGSIKVSSSSDTCDGNNTGTIRFKGNKFQGCTSTGWVDLH